MLSVNAEVRQSFMEACAILAEQEKLKVAVKESGKGALVAGFGVFMGGLLAGPLGMAIGGTVTSLAVAVNAQGKFKSVVEIIVEMSEAQQAQLTQNLQRALKNIKPEDYIKLATLVLTNASIKEIMIIELGSFLKREFQMQMLR